jgi:regulator of sigma E protease
VKVLRFSIGFGPKIVGFTWGETEYRIAWVPLGGYVKMAGELPFEELSPEDARRGFLAQAPWKRAFIVSAGPVFNLIFPVLIFFCVFYFGLQTVPSTRVGFVLPGLPAAEANLMPGDRIVSVDGQPVSTFTELQTLLQPRANERMTLQVNRGGRVFETQLTPTRITHQNVLKTVQRGMIGIAAAPGAPILGVPDGSPAFAAGLRTFDRVLSVNGHPVRDGPDLNDVLRLLTGPLDVVASRTTQLGLPGIGGQSASLVTAQLQRQPGEGAVALGAEDPDLYIASVLPGSPADAAGIRPGDRLTGFNGKPLQAYALLRLMLQDMGEAPLQLAWRSGAEEHSAQMHQASLELDDEYGQKVKSLSLGFSALDPTGSLPESSGAERVVLKLGAVAAMKMSLHAVPEVIQETALAMAKLVTGDVPLDTLGGPVMLFQIAKRSAEEGADRYLGAMALISVNLGLINLLPIPILDGFQLLAAAWEGVRRRPIPMRAREVANMIGLAMLFILMVIVLRNDISNINR